MDTIAQPTASRTNPRRSRVRRRDSSLRKPARRSLFRPLQVESLENRNLLTTTLFDPTGNAWGFGSGVSVSPNWTVVGSPQATDQGLSQAGLAYVFDANGTLQQTLRSPVPGAGDWFGFRTAVDANHVVVSAVRDDSDRGSVYVFDALTGNPMFPLLEPSPAPGDSFGESVSVSGHRAVVGANFANGTGGAFVYDLANNGSLLHTLLNPAASPSDRYGTSVAISGNTVVVGSYGEDNLGSDAGAAYVFDAATGNLLHTLNHPAPHAYDNFGVAVAVSGSRALIGASGFDPNGLYGVEIGAAYVFDTTTGNLVSTLNNPTPTSPDNFGAYVAIGGNRAVVGAYGDSGQAGAVYVFEAATGALQSTLHQPNPQPNDRLGEVAIAGSRLVASASGVDTAGPDSGAVFEFELQSPTKDFGDAPDVDDRSKPGNPPDYRTRLLDGGPWHTIVSGLRMGATVDAEVNGLPNVPANGDDKSNTGSPDDEDGLTPAAKFQFELNLSAGLTPVATILATNVPNDASPASLYGWIDYNRDGVFSTNERAGPVTVSGGSVNQPFHLKFPFVPSTFTGSTYARFRLSRDPNAQHSVGPAFDGEVEDYRVTVQVPSSGTVEKGPDFPLVVKISDTSGGLTPGNVGGLLRNDGHFGRVEPLGDFNLDGVPDMVVGANADNDGGPSHGAIYLVYLNPDGTVLEQHKISETSGNLTPGNAGGLLTDFAGFGSSVALLGDLDGDGFDELAVGAYGEAAGGPARGAVHILFLNADGTVKQQQTISDTQGGLSPGNAGGVIDDFDIFGFAVESLGDINGDGVPDVAVSAVNDGDGGPNRGAVYLLHLNRDGTVQSHAKISDLSGGLSPGNMGGELQTNGYFGVSIANLGDVNGDGLLDLAVGSLDNDGGPNRGAMRVLFLGPAETVASHQKISDRAGLLSPGNRGGVLHDGDEFGRSAAPMGDLDGDGVPDLAVGSYGDDGGPNRGAMDVLFLKHDGTVKRRQRISDTQGGLSPNNAGGTLGDSDRFAARGIARLGDVNGDGVPDLAVSAADDDDGGPERGAAYVLMMAPAEPACAITSPRDLGESLREDASFHFQGPDGQGKDGLCVKLGLDLINAGLEFAYHEANTPAIPFQSSHPLLQVVGDRVIVDVVAAEDASPLERDLSALGMEAIGSFRRTVSGSVPLSALDDVANLASVRFVAPSYRPTTNVVTEGDSVINGPAARSHVVPGISPIAGTGITVGVLSDSFDPSASGLGELPTITQLSGQFGAGTNEGNAMLEIVHDVAPGADLAFATAINSQVGFRQNILALVAAGADVLVDDIGFFAEPMFLDGVVAQTVDEVTRDGVVYFAAAGNMARNSYESGFVAGSTVPSGLPSNLSSLPAGGVFHDFDPSSGSSSFQRVVIPAGVTATFSFQWDEPFASLGCDGSAYEMDFVLLDGADLSSTSTQVLTTGTVNNLGADPVEVHSYTNNTGAPQTVYVALIQAAGPATGPGRMKYIAFGPNVSIVDFPTNSGTVFGHANAAGAIAVGAANYATPTALEPFSSAGGVPILFDSTGANCCTRLPVPEMRQSPDIVAPDGVSTSVAGFAPFFGTSAAAPHAAAVAALMLQAAGGPGSLSPKQVEVVLEDSATAMLAPGFDLDSGYGFIDADKAVSKLLGTSSGGGNTALATPVLTLDVPESALINEQFEFTATFDNGSPTKIGYGPFIDVVLDQAGADGVFNFSGSANAADGLSLTAIDVYDENGLLPAAQVHLLTIGTSGQVQHPFAVDNGGFPLMVQGQPGDLLVAVQLSFGSFAPNQPPTKLTFKPRVSNLADLGHPLYVRARAGFQYGQDAKSPAQAGDGTFVLDPDDSSRWAEEFVTPAVVLVTKTVNAPESETATGPNFPRTWTIDVNVADGQTVTDLQVADALSPAIQFLSFTTLLPGSPPPIVNPSSPFDVTFPSITGTTSTSDARIEFRFLVPEVDANGASVLGAAGQPRRIDNDVKAVGDWQPNDPRDKTDSAGNTLTFVDNALACPCGPESQLVARSLAIQKSVSDVSPLPDDLVTYTLDFQVSDFYGFRNVVIDDLLSDGQVLVGVPTLSVSIDGVVYAAAAMDAANYTVGMLTDTGLDCDGNATPPWRTPLQFRVSNELLARGIVSTSVAATGGVPTGHFLGGLFPPSPVGPDGPTTGRVTFQVRILDQYAAFNASGEPSLNEHDELSNCTAIRGDLVDASLAPTGDIVIDGSRVDLQVPMGTFDKSIYAFNGSTTFTSPVNVTFGDAVTYRLHYQLGPGDFENLKITDFLPDPFYDATSLGPTGPSLFSTVPPTLPQTPGTFHIELHNVSPVAGFPSFLVPDVSNNSVTWDFGTEADLLNDGGDIFIYYTVRRTTDKYADGLLLTNQGVAEHNDTHTHPIVKSDTAQVVSSEPNLKITKGIIAVDDPKAHLSLPLANDFTVSPPCSSGFRVSSTGPGAAINSTNLPGIGDRNLTGADAGDRVTFMIVVENTGSGRFGAFDVRLRDQIPAGFVVPGCGLNLTITDGTGTAFAPNLFGLGDNVTSPYTDQTINTADDLFERGLELLDPGTTPAQTLPPDGTNGGAIDQYDPLDGRNLLVITFDLEVDSSVTPGSVLDNKTTLMNYSGVEGGRDFTDPDPSHANDPMDIGRVTTRGLGLTKSLVRTSEPGTPGSQLTIGEIARYRLVVELPEGQTPNFAITDLLPPSLQYVHDLTATLAFVANGAGISSSLASLAGAGVAGNELNLGSLVPTFVLPPTVLSPSNGDDPTWSLGDLVNADRDADCEFVVIEFNALVTNTYAGSTPENEAGDVLTNRFSVTGTSNAVDIQVVEPRLKVDKQATVDGNTVHYFVTITNVGSSPAYDATFVDPQAPFSPLQFELDLSHHITLNYDVTYPNGPCEDIRNEAVVTYSSLPGAHGTPANPTGSQTPGDPSDPDGEREYVGRDAVLVPNPCGSIHGFKFEDLNADGEYQLGEPLLADVTIVLTWIDPQTGQTQTRTTKTMADGSYWFDDLLPGIAYTVTEIAPDGSKQTTPNPSPITLQPGQKFVAQKFLPNLFAVDTASLLQAVATANANPGPDVIQLGAGNYVLASELVVPDATTAGALTIFGAGVGATSLDGQNLTRLFHVTQGGSLTLDGLTLTRGRAPAFFPLGGAILNDGDLTVQYAEFTNNRAGTHGGAVQTNGVAVFDHVVFRNNAVSGPNATGGGAITNDGTLTILCSQFEANWTDGLLGGGALLNGNHVIGDTTSIRNSYFVGNVVTGLGIEPGGGGAIFNFGQALDIDTSTFEANRAERQVVVGGDGGGAILNLMNLVVRNSTFSANRAGSNGGGAILNNGSSFRLENSTIAENLAEQGGLGGGVLQVIGAPNSIQNTLIAKNAISATIGGGSNAVTGADVSGAFTSLGHNLIGNGVGASGLGVAGDQIGTSQSPVDPLLEPFGEVQQGCGARMYALRPGSPAIDAGIDAAGLRVDQRGMIRPLSFPGNSGAPGGDLSDIGAFEATPANIALPCPCDSLVPRDRLAFGNAFRGSVHGAKFVDRDGDGVWDSVESGLSGVVIGLTTTDAAGVPFTQYTVTMANGEYWFTGLMAGMTYTVAEIIRPLSLVVPSIPADGEKFTLTAGSTTRTFEFESGGGVSLGNTAILLGGLTTVNDVANALVAAVAAAGLGVVPLNLGGGRVLIGDANVFTAHTTQTVLTQLAGGPAATMTQTTPNPPPLFVGSGQEFVATAAQRDALIAAGLDPNKVLIQPRLAFGNQPHDIGNFFEGSVHGIKFADRDGDGVYEPHLGEKPVPFVEIVLEIDADKNGTFESTQTMLTDANGEYWFMNLGPGWYRVRETVPAFSTPTTANPPLLDMQSGDTYVAFAGQVDPLGTNRVEVVERRLAFGNHYEDYGAIHGCKFNDRDGDGIRDDNEGALPGVAFVLYVLTPAGDFREWARTTTAVTGAFWFDELPPGTYKLVELLPDGALATTTLPETIEVGPGETISFGDCEMPGSVHGEKWEDLDGDGLRDPNEPGRAGVRVYADTNGNGRYDDGEPFALTMADDSRTPGSDETGHYWLELPPGQHTIREVLPSGYVQSFPMTGTNPTGGHVVVLDPGVKLEAINFANYRPVEFDVIKYEDKNGNGRRDDGEKGLPDWTITVTGTDGMGNPVNLTATTMADLPATEVDESGMFRFTGLKPGAYTIQELIPQSSDWIAGEGRGGYRGTFSSGFGSDPMRPLPFVFGNYRLGSVHGIKFNDLDGDGRHDDDELGLDGIPIEISWTDPVTGQVTTRRTTTMAGGQYWFEDVPIGVPLTVRELVLPELAPTTPLPAEFMLMSGQEVVGTEDQRQELIAGGVAPDLVVVRPDLVIGNVIFCSIHGVKFYDRNANGVRDLGEEGLGGWAFTLTGVDGQGRAVTASTVSMYDNPTTPENEAGMFWFTNLLPGAYELTESLQRGWVPSTPWPRLDLRSGMELVAVPGQAHLPPGSLRHELVVGDALLIGNYQPRSYEGTKYDDLNGDGDRDPGEPGLPGWMIRLDGVDGMGQPVHVQTFTMPDDPFQPGDQGGRYRFDGLKPGEYRISEVQQSPWLQSQPRPPIGPGMYFVNPLLTGPNGSTTVEHLDFGNYRLGEIIGVAFGDANGNGVFDLWPGVIDVDDGHGTAAEPIGAGAYYKNYNAARSNTAAIRTQEGFGTERGFDIELTLNAAKVQGSTDQFRANVTVRLIGAGRLAGFDRTLIIPATMRVVGETNNAGDSVQTFATEIVSLEGELSGDVDFAELRITAGRDFAMPSLGRVTLSRQPNDTWAVESFFDLDYKLEFTSAAGGALQRIEPSVPMKAIKEKGVQITTAPQNPNPFGGPLAPEPLNSDGRAVTIVLSGTDNQGQIVSRTTTTNDRGEYVFAELPPGSYTVREVVPAGAVLTTPPVTGAIAVGSGQSYVSIAGQSANPSSEVVLGQSLMVGNVVPGSIQGIVFDDTDADGFYEPAADESVPGDEQGPRDDVALLCHRNDDDDDDNRPWWDKSRWRLLKEDVNRLTPMDCEDPELCLPANWKPGISAPADDDTGVDRASSLGIHNIEFLPEPLLAVGPRPGEFVSRGTVRFDVLGTGRLSGFRRSYELPMEVLLHSESPTVTEHSIKVVKAVQRLDLRLPADADFASFRLTAGGDFDLPSPGASEYVRNAAGNWDMTTAFLLNWRFEFVGQPGGPLAGRHGSDSDRVLFGPPSPGEADRPLAGVEIELRGEDALGNLVVRTALTDANGQYSFTNLLPGQYSLTRTPGPCPPWRWPPCPGPTWPWPPTWPTDTFAISLFSHQALVALPGQAGLQPGDPRHEVALDSNLAFGQTKLGSISSSAFDDRNGNGERESLVPLVVPDDGRGSADLFARRQRYALEDGQVFVFANDDDGRGVWDGVLQRVRNVVATPGGSLGGASYRFTADSQVLLRFDGPDGTLIERTIALPLQAELELGSAPPSPLQTLPTKLARLAGSLRNDPDFVRLEIVGRPAAAPGQMTLTREGSNWAVDSFFDVFVAVDYVGRPGSVLDGKSGHVETVVRMVLGAEDDERLEAPLAGVPVVLSGTNALGQPVEMTTVTDAFGLYAFESLYPGVYSVTAIAPPGSERTSNPSSVVPVESGNEWGWLKKGEPIPEVGVSLGKKPPGIAIRVFDDWGDAPDTGPGIGVGNYRTSSADNGPSHTIVAGLFLGSDIDGEAGGLPSSSALGDDLDGADDEDGLTDPSSDLSLTVGQQPTVDVIVTNQTGAAATLFGWIDYDGDGDFELSERASLAVPNKTAGTVTLTFPTVPFAFASPTYARFRLSTDPAAAAPAGHARGGEVEDYVVTIAPVIFGPPVLNATRIADLTPIQAGVLDVDNAGTLVIDFVGDAITDPNASDPRGIAVLAADNARGLWQFSTTGGQSWTTFAGVSPTNAVLLGAGPNDRVRFVPQAGFAGSVDPGLTFRAWDQSDDRPSGMNGVDASVGGLDTPFSAATATTGIDVRAHDARLSLRVTDSAGRPITSILVGRPFVLEGYAEDLRGPRTPPPPRGVFAAYQDVLVDASLVGVSGAVSFGPQYVNATSGSTATTGLINEVGGAAGTTETGLGPVLLFRLSFTANAAGQADFVNNPAEAANHAVLLYGNSAATPSANVDFVGTSLTIVAPPWQNPVNRFDVDGNGTVAPLDALLGINELRTRQFSSPATGEFPPTRPANAPFLDVTGDNVMTPLDVINVINQLRPVPAAPRPEGEPSVVVSAPPAPWDELEELLPALAEDVLRSLLRVKGTADER